MLLLIFYIKLGSDGGKPTIFFNFKGGVIKGKLDLCDILIFRVRNPTARKFTWRCKAPFTQRRLDFFISDEFQDNVFSVDIKPSICSDHSALYLKEEGLRKVIGEFQFGDLIIH